MGSIAIVGLMGSRLTVAVDDELPGRRADDQGLSNDPGEGRRDFNWTCAERSLREEVDEDRKRREPRGDSSPQGASARVNARIVAPRAQAPHRSENAGGIREGPCFNKIVTFPVRHANADAQRLVVADKDARTFRSPRQACGRPATNAPYSRASSSRPIVACGRTAFVRRTRANLPELRSLRLSVRG
jgi:hypothetical protein